MHPAFPPSAPGPNSPPQAPLGFDDEGEDLGVNVRRYVSAIFRYKWLVMGLGLLGAAGGFALTKAVRPIYEAQASIQVPPPNRLGVAANPLRAQPLLEGLGWVELLRSWAVLDEVVKQARLYLEVEALPDSVAFREFGIDEVFVPGSYAATVTPQGIVLASRDGQRADTAAAGDSLGRPFGFRWVPGNLPADREVRFIVRGPRDAAVRLGNDLGTFLPQDGALLRLTLRGQDPVATAATINSLAMRFVEVASLLKREKLAMTSEVLREQLANSRVELADAERALELFKVRTITLPSDRGALPIAAGIAETRDPVRQAFFQLKIDRDDLVRDRDAIARALRLAADSGQSLVISLGTIGAVQEQPELVSSMTAITTRRGEARQMRVVFAPTHPPLLQLEREIAALETETLPAQVRGLLAALDTRISQFDERIAASSREMQQIPLRVTEENRLERDVDVKQMIFTQMQSAYEQARLSELSASPDVRLLDSAVPPTRPVRDQVIVLLFGSAFAGFAFGLGLALLLDKLDKRVRYPEQVSKDLGLQILGALPLLRKTSSGAWREVDEEQLLEAVRSLRMSLLYAHGTAGAFLTTVTSPGSGDGKSFVSLQLARSLAQSGRRTLLVDGDNRRGHLHREAGVPRRPGLTDLLMGRATLPEVVHSIGDGVDLIPAGTSRQNAPELLASPEMMRLMSELRPQYQAIVLDSPPLGAGVDPLVLASHSGTMVMVMRTGVTDRELAEARLHDLQRLPIRVLGAILNDVKASGVYRYYGYLPGYRTRNEDEDVSPARVTSGRRISGGRAQV